MGEKKMHTDDAVAMLLRITGSRREVIAKRGATFLGYERTKGDIISFAHCLYALGIDEDRVFTLGSEAGFDNHHIPNIRRKMQELYGSERKCAECGEIFTLEQPDSPEEQFCSEECEEAYRRHEFER